MFPIIQMKLVNKTILLNMDWKSECRKIDYMGNNITSD